jgi:hypothetical protein
MTTLKFAEPTHKTLDVLLDLRIGSASVLLPHKKWKEDSMLLNKPNNKMPIP